MNESDGPIVAAVREARAAIIADCDYDLRRLAERLRRIEHQHATRIVSPKGKHHKPIGITPKP